MTSSKSRNVRFNSKEVTIPWFVVGTPEVDIRETIKAIQDAVKVNKIAAD